MPSPEIHFARRFPGLKTGRRFNETAMTGCEHHKGGEGEKQFTAVDAARKMLKFGISALTDVELLALFLRTGTRGKDVLTLAKRCWRISALFMAC